MTPILQFDRNKTLFSATIKRSDILMLFLVKSQPNTKNNLNPELVLCRVIK